MADVTELDATSRLSMKILTMIKGAARELDLDMIQIFQAVERVGATIIVELISPEARILAAEIMAKHIVEMTVTLQGATTAASTGGIQR